MRAIPALIVIGLLAAAAGFLASEPGKVALTWQGWRVETSVALLVLGVVLLAMLAAALFHLIRKILGGPRAIMRARREKRRREGYRALTQGMVAVAAGDAEEAQRHARKADMLLAEPPLTLLLSAQAAQLKGDEHAARKYFTAMLERAETEFLGLRGLVMQALRGGDERAALRLVERAKELRPKTPWVLQSLFELQARAGKLIEAEATLAEALKRKVLSAETLLHHRVVLLHERSREAEAQGDHRQALQLAAKAHGLEPGFAPATARYAELLRIGGWTRRAAKAVETAWRAAPHPDLAAAWHALASEETPVARVKYAERLAAANPEHPESRLVQARAALAARLWGEARRHLEALGGKAEAESAPSPRICQHMAELEEQQHQDQPAAHRWLARAAASATPDPTWICGACGAETPRWSATCPACHAFASLTWRSPAPGTPRRLPAAPEGMTPALPVPAPWSEAETKKLASS